ETDGRDRLHVWLLRIVGASTAPTSMALPCRWRSRPQHQKRTFVLQQKSNRYSIASSAVNKRFGGIVRPSALAVLRLITSSYLTGSWKGRSPAFSPRRIRPT